VVFDPCVFELYLPSFGYLSWFKTPIPWLKSRSGLTFASFRPIATLSPPCRDYLATTSLGAAIERLAVQRYELYRQTNWSHVQICPVDWTRWRVLDEPRKQRPGRQLDAWPASASTGQKPNNLPAVAFQYIPKLPVENFPVGRRHLQAESVVAVAQQLATNFEPRTGDETYQ